jgi:hypothetical protein
MDPLRTPPPTAPRALRPPLGAPLVPADPPSASTGRGDR